MAKRIAAFLLILMITLVSVPAVYAVEADKSIQFPAYVVVSADTGQILMEKGSTEAANISLLYRMMVCLLTLENLDTSLTAEMADQYYPLSDLLKLSLLTDHPTATAVLADKLTPVADSLIIMLNQRAAEIGLTGTLFTSSAKADTEFSHTTLQDVARFLSYAVTNSEFNKLFCTQAAVLSADGTLISNTNRMVLSAGGTKSIGGILGTYIRNNTPCQMMGYMEGVISEKNDSLMNLIVVADRITDNDYERSGENLLAYVRRTYCRISAVSPDQTLLSLPVGNETLDLTAAAAAYCITADPSENPVSQISFSMKEGYDMTDIRPPILRETEIGTANIQLFDGTTVIIPVKAGNTIYFQNQSINSFFTALIGNRQILFLICLLAGVELLLLISRLRLKYGK